ncbi:MAG: hypothetical protein H0W65_06810 [Sphingomonas sp.]|uniref:hypothetical protein n=1 Tax=Sphingomonas sp. TaxID=28214 RepID=UPI0017C309EA|nr:hypothetical protein [Sphingomonas sp.]MBA3667416.1 hypothetical protein [Sphingomonas sp.]
MTIRRSMILLATASLTMLAACNKSPVTEASRTDTAAKPDASAAAKSTDPIESALAAAPASIGKDAKIVAMKADGSMSVLREGANGWTCMGDNPATPGADPMCMDANAMKWAEAWIGHKPPPADNVGLMYMLAGGSDASNTDPWGKQPKDGGKWVETGPHVMVVGSDSLNKLYPAGGDPDTSKPYVMFGGTPYAHVMMPIG